MPTYIAEPGKLISSVVVIEEDYFFDVNSQISEFPNWKYVCMHLFIAFSPSPITFFKYSGSYPI